MCRDDLLGDGKPQSSAAAIGRTRRIQAIELLKDHLELCLRDGIALIDKAHAHATAVPASGLDRDGRALVAIGNSVFHDVVEHASHFVAIHEHRQVLANINLDFLMLLVEDGIELVSHLSQQQPQINIAAREHDIVEVKARDIEELFDERIEPVRLVERHARKVRTLLNRQLRSLLQQRKIAHHTGKRGA